MTNPHAPYRQIGDTTLDVYTAELEKVGSPMRSEASAIHAAASPHSALFLAMAWIENKYATTGIIIKSEHHNPVSLRPWTSDPRGMPPGAVGVTTAPDGGQFLRFASWADCVREWKRRLFDDPDYKGGVYKAASSLGEMLNTYAPPHDVHPITGLANEDIAYAEGVGKLLGRFAAAEGKEPAVSANKHIYALSMGHRNNDRGGATGEIEWTPWATRMLADALRARGARAYIVHEHDNDSDPDFTRQGLDRIGHIVCEIDRKFGPLTAYLSMHYNGGGSPGFHAIFPDGWNDGDTRADNPRDIQTARAICDRVVATNTVKALGWTRECPGVMSEHETGAVSGRHGYRLAEMRSSYGVRTHAVRIILEAGSIDTPESRYITNPAWVRDVYCPAIIDGLRDVFGPFPNDSSGTQIEEPEQPASVFVKPIERPCAEQLRAGASSVRLPDANHPQGFVTWFAVDRMYRTKKDVARQQVATDTSEVINEPVPAGTAIKIDAVGTNYKGDAYGLSPWGTMFRLDDLEPLPWPEMPDLRSSMGEQPGEAAGERLMDDLQAASEDLVDADRARDTAPAG
jgi:hypothetical protein